MTAAVTVIMCVYKRVERLPETIRLLEQQTNKNFRFIIWNNSGIEISPQSNSLNMLVHNSEKNIGGIGRFYAVKTYCGKFEKIIFIDDDQIFNNTLIADFIKIYEVNKIKSWHSFIIIDENNYFNRKKISKCGVKCNYCGTGGMILNSSIFFDEGLYQIPNEYIFIEDLWLSFYAITIHGYVLEHASVNIQIIIDEHDQYKLLIDKKTKFLKYLIEKKWNIRNI